MNSYPFQQPQMHQKQQQHCAQDPKKSAPRPPVNPQPTLSHPPSQASKHPSLVPHPHPHAAMTPTRGSGVPHTPKAPAMSIFPPGPTLRERYESTKSLALITPEQQYVASQRDKPAPPPRSPTKTHRLPQSGPRLTTSVNVPDEDYEKFYKNRMARS